MTVVVGAAGVLTFAGCIFEGQSCTEIGCLDGVEILGPMSASPDTIIVTLCLNGRCSSSGSIARNGSASADGDLAFLVSRTAPADVLYVSLSLEQNALPAHDGDIVDLTVRDGATQVPIEQRSWVLDYQKTQPNGADCPPTCQEAKLEL